MNLRSRGRFALLLHPLHKSNCPIASLPPGPHHPDPNIMGALGDCKTRCTSSILLRECGTIIISELCKQIYQKHTKEKGGAVSYVDGEVSRCAAQGPTGGQGFGDVLQGEGRGLDLHGQTDHQVPRRAPEGPAVPRLDIWLHTQGSKAVVHESTDH